MRDMRIIFCMSDHKDRVFEYNEMQMKLEIVLSFLFLSLFTVAIIFAVALIHENRFYLHIQNILPYYHLPHFGVNISIIVISFIIKFFNNSLL